jgi:putative MATE family efflux protein
VYDRQTTIDLSRTITRMTLPILVEQFFIVLMGVVSTMLVSNIGRDAVSAVGNIDVINNIMISVFSSLAIGGTILVAQFSGRGDTRSASRAASQAMMASVVLSLGVTIIIYFSQHGLVEALYGKAEPIVRQNSLDYLRIVVWSYPPLALATTAFGLLRGNGNMRAPMIISIIMNLANILMSSVLIYGFKLDLGWATVNITGRGVTGAAIGLTLARLLGFILAIVMISKSELAFSFAMNSFWRVEKKMLNTILFLGVPAGFEQLMFNGGKLIVQIFIVRMGTAALAANSISNSLAAMATLPTIAMSMALTTLVGQLVGRGDKIAAKKLLTFALPFSFVILFVMSAVALPLIQPIIGMFTKDVATRHEALIVMVIYLIAQPFLWSASFALPAGFRGAGDVRYQLTVTMISMWALRIGLGYTLTVVLNVGLIGIWIAMLCDWALRALLFSLRLRSGRWLRHALIH